MDFFVFLSTEFAACSKQRWSRGHKTRGQGQGHKKTLRPRPRTGLLEAKAKDRIARGQGQGPRTQAQVLSKKKKVFTKIFQAISKKKKKKVLTKIFQAISTKKRFLKNFSSTPQNFNNSKNSAVLKDLRPIFEGLRPRGQGQGLQNVSSRTSK